MQAKAIAPGYSPGRETIMSDEARWPDLPLDAWKGTCDTLHLWTQIVGKVRLASTPLVNHWWNVTLHVNSRGLVAPANSYRGRTFDVVFDFVDHPMRLSYLGEHSIKAIHRRVDYQLDSLACLLPHACSDFPRLPDVNFKRLIANTIYSDADPTAGTEILRLEVSSRIVFDERRLQALRGRNPHGQMSIVVMIVRENGKHAFVFLHKKRRSPV